MEPELEKDANTKEGTKKIKIEKLFDFEPRGYYVYVHRKMTNGEIFYVGKGKGIRGWGSNGRNKFWRIKAIKHGVGVEIVYDNLTEDYALELERELIAFYGRVSEGEGTLVNFMSVGNENPGVSGIKNAVADKRIHHFVNVFTYESFIGYQVEFKKVKGFSMSPVINRSALVFHGWTLMDILSTVELSRLRNPNAGKYNGRANKTIFHFYNMETEEELIGDKLDFEAKTGFMCTDLIRRTVLVFNDWCLYENKHKWYSMQKDYRKYLFVHNDGRQYYCTRLRFEKETGYDIQNLFSKKTNCFTHYGWRVIK